METNKRRPIFPPIRKSIPGSGFLICFRPGGIDATSPVSVFNPSKRPPLRRFVQPFRPLITIPDLLFELLSVASSSLARSVSLPDTPFLRSSVLHPSAPSRRPVTVQPIPWLIAHGSAGDVSNCTVCRCVSKRVSQNPFPLSSSSAPTLLLSPCPRSFATLLALCRSRV